MKHHGLRLGLVFSLVFAAWPYVGIAAAADSGGGAKAGDFQGLLAKAVQDSEARSESVTAARVLPGGAEVTCRMQGLLAAPDRTGGDVESLSESEGGGPLPVESAPLCHSGGEPLAEPDSPQADQMLQFRSQGHVLGFRHDGYYVSNGTYALRVGFAGANPVTPKFEAGITPGSGLSADSNRATDAPPLSSVLYTNVWHGVSVTYDRSGGGIITSTYRLEPYADPAAIRLNYSAPVHVNDDGTLSVSNLAGSLTESAPVAWQDREGTRVPVHSAFRLLSDAAGRSRSPVVGFAVGDYDQSRPLFIDPTTTWNTFLGGSGGDGATEMVVDADGNAYVVGSSTATWGSPANGFAGGSRDVFVAKLDANGVLLWNTFLGSGGTDLGYGIGVDGGGNVYVGGFSDSAWGSPVRGFSGGGGDGFVAKLDSVGALQWNTFMGSGAVDYACFDLAADASGNSYVVGNSNASWGSPVNGYGGGGGGDAFAAKVDSSGNLVWNTFLGSASTADTAQAVAVDGSGNVYVGGYGASWGSPIRGYTGGNDAWIAKLNSAGALQWNTFLGGSGDDFVWRMEVDGGGDLCVTGEGTAAWGSPLRAYTGGWDTYAAKLTSGGALTWLTFIGGAADERIGGVAVDGSRNLYVVGNSSGTWGSPLDPFTGGSTGAYVVKLSAPGDLAWNTFLGGVGNHSSAGCAVLGTTSVYVAGGSSATWGAPKRAFDTAGDAFVVRLYEPLPEMDVQGNGTSIADGDATPSSSDWTDFGSADIAGGTVDRTFTVLAADGYLSLNGSPKVAIGGANAADFSVTVQPSSPVAQGASTTFTVRFVPSATGVRTATVSIANNDSDENPYDFTIQGTGFSLEMDVQGNSISITDGDTTPSLSDHTSFGVTDVNGGTLDRTFTIRNTGNVDLPLTGDPKVAVSGTNAADFIVTSQPISPVTGGGSVTFTVRFDPSASGARTAILSIANDDSDENPYDFAISGYGLVGSTGVPSEALEGMRSQVLPVFLM